jgi:multicomponent Na+:H+ antiporter subunit E
MLMNRVLAAILTVFLCFFVYLLFTTASGAYISWSLDELIAGIILATIIGLVSFKMLVKRDLRMANPLRWILALAYFLGPFLFSMAKANLDVAYRVITGKIKPGIVKISPDLKTDLGITLFANSITLTPGTLSVDVDEETNELYVHWINVKKLHPTSQQVAGSFEKWVRRITE